MLEIASIEVNTFLHLQGYLFHKPITMFYMLHQYSLVGGRSLTWIISTSHNAVN